VNPASPIGDAAGRRHAAWFHELDAWTEYWDLFHPETAGRYYFGNDAEETGLLTRFLPRKGMPAPYLAWTRMALGMDTREAFELTLREPDVAYAVLEVDRLVGDIFSRHFGSAGQASVRDDYLDAVHAFATDTLPPATDRDALVADDDPRKPTAGRHTLDGDMMWFAWALHTEAAAHLAGMRDGGHARRSLMLAGVASGCPANFAWRGHRRTRAEYLADDATRALLLTRGRAGCDDFEGARREVHALFRIREWGHED